MAIAILQSPKKNLFGGKLKMNFLLIFAQTNRSSTQGDTDQSFYKSTVVYVLCIFLKFFIILCTTRRNIIFNSFGLRLWADVAIAILQSPKINVFGGKLKMNFLLGTFFFFSCEGKSFHNAQVLSATAT